MKVTLYCLHCLFPHEFTGPSMFAVDSFVCVKCGREGAQAADQPNAVGPLTLDTDRQVFFYEQDFYVLSNFSSFALDLGGHMYPTSEHAYHAHKFPGDSLKQAAIRCAKSAHDAFKLAERWKQYRMGAWEQVRVDIMRGILRAKAAQHEYVRRKLLATGDRELIENSWRDDFWGWGPNRDGQNMLGQLWMEIRAEQRAADNSSQQPAIPSFVGVDFASGPGHTAWYCTAHGAIPGPTCPQCTADNSSAAAPAKVCPNCDTALPEGCGGLFRDDGESCWLNPPADGPSPTE